MLRVTSGELPEAFGVPFSIYDLDTVVGEADIDEAGIVHYTAPNGSVSTFGAPFAQEAGIRFQTRAADTTPSEVYWLRSLGYDLEVVRYCRWCGERLADELVWDIDVHPTGSPENCEEVEADVRMSREERP